VQRPGREPSVILPGVRGLTKLELLVAMAAIAFLTAMPIGGSPGLVALVLALAALLVIILGGPLLYRTSPLRATRLALFFGLGFAAVLGLNLLVGNSPGKDVVAVFLSVILAVAGAVGHARLSRSPPGAPDVLADRVGGEIREADGVQYSARCTGEVQASTPGEIHLHLQNTWDGARTVRVQLRERAFGRLRVREQTVRTLAPLEVGKLVLAVVGAPGEAEEGEVFVTISARGLAGRRVRLQHAPEQNKPSPRFWLLLILSNTSWAMTGTRLSFRIAQIPKGPERPIPEPSWETLWGPGEAGAPEARRLIR
jgi:hypothetical protein